MNVNLTTGPVFTLWHGGPNYGPTDRERDIERFNTVEDAATEAWNRLRCPNFANAFRYVREIGPTYARTPLVDEGESWVEVYLADPRGESDVEPDAVLTYDDETGEYAVAEGHR